MTALQFARVLIDSPLPPLDYKVPEEMALAVGDRVVVPLQTKFAADYYLAFWGEAALSALPPFWRRVPKARHEATVASLRELKPRTVTSSLPPVLNPEQAAAVEAITSARGFSPFLLFIIHAILNLIL